MHSIFILLLNLAAMGTGSGRGRATVSSEPARRMAVINHAHEYKKKRATHTQMTMAVKQIKFHFEQNSRNSWP